MYLSLFLIQTLFLGQYKSNELMLLQMIAILSSYTELLNKLDIDEKTKTINKTMEGLR